MFSVVQLTHWRWPDSDQACQQLVLSSTGLVWEGVWDPQGAKLRPVPGPTGSQAASGPGVPDSIWSWGPRGAGLGPVLGPAAPPVFTKQAWPARTAGCLQQQLSTRNLLVWRSNTAWLREFKAESLLRVQDFCIIYCALVACVRKWGLNWLEQKKILLVHVTWSRATHDLNAAHQSPGPPSTSCQPVHSFGLSLSPYGDKTLPRVQREVPWESSFWQLPPKSLIWGLWRTLIRKLCCGHRRRPGLILQTGSPAPLPGEVAAACRCRRKALLLK